MFSISIFTNFLFFNFFSFFFFPIYIFLGVFFSSYILYSEFIFWGNTFRENKIMQLYSMCKWLCSTILISLIHHLRSMAANNRYYLRRYLKTLLAACLTVEAGWERYSRNVEIYSGHPGSKQLRGITWKEVTLVIRFLPLILFIFFLAFDFCRFYVVIRFFHPLRLRRIFYPRFYPLHLFSYLNSWDKTPDLPHSKPALYH